MIARIALNVAIATIAALVVSIKSLQSLTIVHDGYVAEVDSDSIPAIVIVAIVGSSSDHW